MDTLLLFFLSFAGRRLWWASSAHSQCIGVEEWVVGQAREGRVNIEASTIFAKDGVGVFYVGAGEGLDGILERCETGDDLKSC